jgi:hypothetical protein
MSWLTFDVSWPGGPKSPRSVSLTTRRLEVTLTPVEWDHRIDMAVLDALEAKGWQFAATESIVETKTSPGRTRYLLHHPEAKAAEQAPLLDLQGILTKLNASKW